MSSSSEVNKTVKTASEDIRKESRQQCFNIRRNNLITIQNQMNTSSDSDSFQENFRIKSQQKKKHKKKFTLSQLHKSGWSTQEICQGVFKYLSSEQKLNFIQQQIIFDYCCNNLNNFNHPDIYFVSELCRILIVLVEDNMIQFQSRLEHVLLAILHSFEHYCLTSQVQCIEKLIKRQPNIIFNLDQYYKCQNHNQNQFSLQKLLINSSSGHLEMILLLLKFIQNKEIRQAFQILGLYQILEEKKDKFPKLVQQITDYMNQ